LQQKKNKSSNLISTIKIVHPTQFLNEFSKTFYIDCGIKTLDSYIYAKVFLNSGRTIKISKFRKIINFKTYKIPILEHKKSNFIMDKYFGTKHIEKLHHKIIYQKKTKSNRFLILQSKTKNVDGILYKNFYLEKINLKVKNNKFNLNCMY